jgi:hypothetical protein
MAIDQVVAAGGDFREDYRSRQVGCPDGSLLESLAATIIRNVRELDDPDGESLRMSADERQESCDVELEDPVRVELITGLGGAELEVPVQLELRRLLNRLRGFEDHVTFRCGGSADPDRRTSSDGPRGSYTSSRDPTWILRESGIMFER